MSQGISAAAQPSTVSRRAPATQRAQPSAAAELTVAATMSSPVHVVGHDEPAHAALLRMLELEVGGMPVIDAQGRPLGMLSKTDLLDLFRGPGGPPAAAPRVRDLMAPFLLAVPKDAPLQLALSLMAYEGVQRLVVLDAAKQMAGILTTLDVLRCLAQLGGHRLLRPTQRQRQRRLRAV